jgi:hypothetical protein
MRHFGSAGASPSLKLKPDDYFVSNDTNSFASAILRMSSVIFIEQYFGPHMLQK